MHNNLIGELLAAWTIALAAAAIGLMALVFHDPGGDDLVAPEWRHELATGAAPSVFPQSGSSAVPDSTRSNQGWAPDPADQPSAGNDAENDHGGDDGQPGSGRRQGAGAGPADRGQRLGEGGEAR